MEQVLQNIPMTVVYLDDILVSGSTTEEHDRNLRTLLTSSRQGPTVAKREVCFRQKYCRYCSDTPVLYSLVYGNWLAAPPAGLVAKYLALYNKVSL